MSCLYRNSCFYRTCENENDLFSTMWYIRAVYSIRRVKKGSIHFHVDGKDALSTNVCWKFPVLFFVFCRFCFNRPKMCVELKWNEILLTNRENKTEKNNNGIMKTKVFWVLMMVSIRRFFYWMLVCTRKNNDRIFKATWNWLFLFIFILLNKSTHTNS